MRPVAHCSSSTRSPTCRRAIRVPPPSMRPPDASSRHNRSRSAALEHYVHPVKIYTKTGDAGETGLFGVGLVHVAVGLHARIVFGNAAAAEESRLTCITSLRRRPR